jgi:hypothetical protein
MEDWKQQLAQVSEQLRKDHFATLTPKEKK